MGKLSGRCSYLTRPRTAGVPVQRTNACSFNVDQTALVQSTGNIAQASMRSEMLNQAQSIAQYLLTLSQERRTGELLVGSATHQPWKLYFYSGRLIYATGGQHAVRRWYRAMSRHSDRFDSSWFKDMRTPDDYWEVDFINQVIQRKYLSLDQAKAVFQSIVNEVVLTLVDYPAEDVRWYPNRLVAQQLMFVSVQRVVVRSQQIYHHWQTIGGEHLPTLLPHELPYLSPIVINPRGLRVHLSSHKYDRLTPWMQGNITLWDMAAQAQRSLPEVIKLLVPFIYQGWVDLKAIPDIPPPYIPARPLSTSRQRTKGLIACIDDSPMVSKVMAELVHPLGYEVLPVTKPVEQISTLSQHHPDLIFLDITMPNISGYGLCKFLRSTKAFYKTPIIMLTGRDGVIDRMRAKIVGADDFLAKPPLPEKIAQLLTKYISEDNLL